MAADQLQQDEQYLEGPLEESGDGMLAMMSRSEDFTYMLQRIIFFSSPILMYVQIYISPFSLRHFASGIAYSSLLEYLSQ